MYAEFDFQLQMTSDPSDAELEADVCDFKWLERISRQKHVLNVPFLFPVAGQKNISVGALIAGPKLLVIRTDKPITVGLDDAVSRVVAIDVVNNRYGYLIVTAPSVMSTLYFTTTQDNTSVNFIAIGDDQ